MNHKNKHLVYFFEAYFIVVQLILDISGTKHQTKKHKL